MNMVATLLCMKYNRNLNVHLVGLPTGRNNNSTMRLSVTNYLLKDYIFEADDRIKVS